LGEKLGFQPASQEKRRAVALGIDVPFLLIVIILLIFGILMVYSASWDFSYDNWEDPLYTLSRQVRWLALGVVAFIIMSVMDYHWWTKFVLPGMIITIILLMAVLFFGDERFGARRTLFGGSIQPSELAKLMIVVYLSVWLYNKRHLLKDLSFGLFPLAVILGVVGAMIILQPDLSAVLTIFILGGLMFFLAGGDLKQIFLLLVLGLLVGVVVVNMPTGKERIGSFWAGLNDLWESSGHVRRSIEAFANGGWLGVGIGKGWTKLTGLPFPHTDSIFAVIGEETGVLGSATLILLYAGLLWRGIAISQNARDGLGRLLAAGLTFWIVIEAIVNMAVMVNLLPFAGNALPLISSGGSSLVMTLAALGVVMNVARHGETNRQVEERTFNAVANLRGRDRRRRVSGASRSAGAGFRR
jgi:cell division protein FtsW